MQHRSEGLSFGARKNIGPVLSAADDNGAIELLRAWHEDPGSHC